MSFRTDLDAVVLGAIQGRSQHGYEIAKRIVGQSGGALRIGEGQLYPVLHKLEGRGLIDSEWVPQEGKPARKVYSITDEGLKELELKRQGWQKFVRGVGAILNHPKEAGCG